MTPPNFFWRRVLVTPVPWLLLAVMVGAQFLVAADVAADVEGDNQLGNVLMFAAVVPVGWAVLETMWLSFSQIRPMIALARTRVLPLVMGPILGITAALATMRPGVQDVIESSRRDDGWHYWFDASRGGGNVASELPLYILANMFAPMLAGLALVVFVVLPWFAFMRPAEFVEANMMDTRPEAAVANASGARFLSILLMLTFAGPTLVVGFASQNKTGLGWLLAIGAVAVGLWLMFRVMSKQVPDHEARASLPVWARGVQARHHRPARRDDGSS